MLAVAVVASLAGAPALCPDPGGQHASGVIHRSCPLELAISSLIAQGEPPLANPRAAGSYDFMPNLGELRDSVPSATLERPELSKRDRSLITCPVLKGLL